MSKRNLIIVAVLCLACMFVIGATHACKNYNVDGGDRQVIGGDLEIVSGGTVNFKSGSLLQIATLRVCW